jgi:hypothetical protein
MTSKKRNLWIYRHSTNNVHDIINISISWLMLNKFSILKTPKMT